MIAANKLRIHVMIQCICLLSQHSGLSWMHQIHLILQPMVFFVTLDPSWSSYVLWLVIFATGLDFLVLTSAGVVVTRCLSDPGPACVQQSLDHIQVVVVAMLHVVIDVSQLLNLNILSTRESTEVKQEKRMVIVSWFMFVQDAACLLTAPTGVELIVFMSHPVFNLLVCWIAGSTDRNKYRMLSVVAVLFLGVDTFLFVERTSSILQQGFLLMYILTDILYAYFGYMASLSDRLYDEKVKR